VKRRQFIGIAATGATAAVCRAVGHKEQPGALSVLATPRLPETICDERTINDIGGCYRQMVPAENNAETLTQAILTDLGMASSAFDSTANVLPARVEHQVQRDFAHGRTVTVNGWILSVTEARQCALYSLHHD
jgi:hypothetical protein